MVVSQDGCAGPKVKTLYPGEYRKIYGRKSLEDSYLQEGVERI